MNRSQLLVLSLVLAASVDAGTRPVTTAASDEHLKIAAGGRPAVMAGPTGTSLQCGLKSVLKVSVRALSTPLVDRDLELEITVANGGADDTVRSWIRLPAGVDATAQPEWTEFLAHGQVVTHRATVRIAGGGPFALTAKAAFTAPGAEQLPPGEGYTTLYPLSVTPAGVRAYWSAKTLLPLSAPQPEVVTLKRGDRVTLIHGDQ